MIFQKKNAENKMEEKTIIEFIPESNEKKQKYDKNLFNYFLLALLKQISIDNFKKI